MVVSNPQANLTVGSIVNSATILAKAGDGGSGGLSQDGFTWPQSPPLIVDNWGKLIVCFSTNDANMHWMWSNDSGQTWTVNTNNIDGGALTRASLAVDTISGLLVHALWQATASTDGMIYRRYTITRDGSNNITNIAQARDTNVNLQLDFQGTGTMNYNLPVAMWVPEGGTNGSLLFIWGATNAGTGGGSEVRASRRVLSLTIADNTAGNWVAPVSSSSTGIGNAPAVAYTAVTSTANKTGIGCSAARKNVGSNQLDVVVVYTDGTNTGVINYRRLRWNSSNNDWSTGMTTPVALSNIQRAGTDSLGYTAKYQLLGQPRWDKNGNVGVYMTTYKDNTNRDTATLIGLNDAETTTTLADAYSATSHQDNTNKFVTGDASYDSGLDNWVVSYTDLPAKNIYVVAYDSTLASTQNATAVYTTRPVDIPTMVNGRLTQSGTDRLFILSRDFNAAAAAADGQSPTYTPPYTGLMITMDWASASSNYKILGDVVQGIPATLTLVGSTVVSHASSITGRQAGAYYYKNQVVATAGFANAAAITTLLNSGAIVVTS